jgi:hypothetical protein
VYAGDRPGDDVVFVAVTAAGVRVDGTTLRAHIVDLPA